MDQPAAGRRRRFHSEEFKAQAVQASRHPGVSMAAVAMAHGINANLLRRWVHAASQPVAESSTVSVTQPVGFIALPMPQATAPTLEPIRIELRRGSTTIAVTWPATAADACAAWMRELLR